jgi:Uma2 family endonuclease
MNPTTQPMTAAELEQLPKRDKLYELVKGELRTMPPAGGEHGFYGMNLSGPLHAYVRKHQLGIVLLADTGFVLERDPDTVRAPDAAFLRNDRLPETGIPKSFWAGPPDLAVEVISPGDTMPEVEEKVRQWLEAGTVLVWVVNPRRRIVTVYRGAGDSTVLTDKDTLDGGELIPGFTLPVADIFS